jgi:hypothetical protein
MDVRLKSVLLNLLDSQGGEERILLNDLPGIQIQLRIDGPLGLIQDIKAEVLRLNGVRITSSMGR